MELNSLPSGLSQGCRIWQTHTPHSLCPWTTCFPAVWVSGRLRYVSTDPVPKHIFGTPKYQGKQILQRLQASSHHLPRSHWGSWWNGIVSATQINLPRYFLAGDKKKKDKAGHAGAPLTLVGPSSALSLSWARRLREKSWQQTTKRLLHFSSKGFTSGSIPEKSSL